MLQQLQRKGATVKSAIDRRAFLLGKAPEAPAAAADAAFLEMPHTPWRAAGSAAGAREDLPSCEAQGHSDEDDDVCGVAGDQHSPEGGGDAAAGSVRLAAAADAAERRRRAGRRDEEPEGALGTSRSPNNGEAPAAGAALGLLRALEPGSALSRLLHEGMLTMSEPTRELQRLFGRWARQVSEPSEADARALALLMCQLAVQGRDDAAVRVLGSCALHASRGAAAVRGWLPLHWRAVVGYAFERLADAVDAARGYRLHPGPLEWMLQGGE